MAPTLFRIGSRFPQQTETGSNLSDSSREPEDGRVFGVGRDVVTRRCRVGGKLEGGTEARDGIETGSAQAEPPARRFYVGSARVPDQPVGR